MLKRIVVICVAFGTGAWGQSVTSNIGLALPQQFATNWNVAVNGNSTLLDAYLSGNLPIPGLRIATIGTQPACTINNRGQIFVVQGNGVTTSDQLQICELESSGSYAWLSFGSGAGGVSSFSAPTTSWPTWLVPSVATATSSPTLSVSAVTQGNGSKVQLSTGGTVSGHCVAFDSNGNTVDSGGACQNATVVTPGGAVGALQFNNGGTFGGVALGTTSTVYHGNASGVGFFGPVVLTTDLSGILPVANGGTGVSLSQGNGTKVQLSSGSTVANDCVKFDVFGNTVDAGAACGSGGGSAFSALTSGTNTAAAMVIGTGSSLTVSGSGSINATQVAGVTITGTPSSGYIPVATSSSAATWQAHTMAFSGLTSATNTTAAMILGTGASLTVSGSGTINATAIGGITITGTPSSGYVPTATGSSTATWQAQAASSFGTLSSGTNTAAAMLVGTGGSLGITGSGTINATAIGGITVTGTPSSGYIPTATGSSAATWQAAPGGSLPSQTGNAGLYLTTNGTAASWGNIQTGPSGGLACGTGSLTAGTCDIVSSVVGLLANANVWSGSQTFQSLAELQGVGSAPAITNGTGTVATNAGSNNVAGTLTSSTSGTVTFTMTWASALAYTHRAVCHFTDETTLTDSIHTTQATVPTTTTLTATGTTVSGDILSYSCSGF